MTLSPRQQLFATPYATRALTTAKDELIEQMADEITLLTEQLTQQQDQLTQHQGQLAVQQTQLDQQQA